MKTALLYIASAHALLMMGSGIAAAQTGAPVVIPSVAPAPLPVVIGGPPQPIRMSDNRNSYLPPIGGNRLGTSPFAQTKFFQQQYQQAQIYGRCVANVSPQRARAVLDASPNTRTELVEINQLSGLAKGCLPYGYAPSIVFLRGSLAEAMYQRQPIALALHAAGTTDADLSAFQQAEDARSGARLPDDRAYSAVSNCLVVRAPAASRNVLLTDHGSIAERKAVKQLISSAAGCSSTTRFPTTASTSFIRAYLAESALRWSEFAADHG